ncbi:hypothetical protein DD563_14715 [Pelagicola sp. LXJ1103]|nr:hypothetical protein DD563_14715 [Pelagicola sp. LXJ1103]
MRCCKRACHADTHWAPETGGFQGDCGLIIGDNVNLFEVLRAECLAAFRIEKDMGTVRPKTAMGLIERG